MVKRKDTTMSRKLIRRVLLAALAVGVGGTAMLSAGDAEARGRRVGQWTYESDRPLKGYEGFLFPGYYCSYRRFPVRTCTYDRQGRESCKVTSWRMEQSCS
jgi:hypothetical protein